MGCCASREEASYSSSGSPDGAQQQQAGQQPHPNLLARTGGVRPSQFGRPTIDPTTGLPIQKKKKTVKKNAQRTDGNPRDAPDLTKTCTACGHPGTLFSKEGFSYCGMACLKVHGQSVEFHTRYAENEKMRNP
jgi:hypothetical protein